MLLPGCEGKKKEEQENKQGNKKWGGRKAGSGKEGKGVKKGHKEDRKSFVLFHAPAVVCFFVSDAAAYEGFSLSFSSFYCGIKLLMMSWSEGGGLSRRSNKVYEIREV